MRDIFQLDPQVFADQRSAGQCRDVTEHCFSAVTKTGSLDGTNIQRATQLVDDQ